MWADLGCGNGIAARDALGGRLPERVLLVDNSEDALAQAPRESERRARSAPSRPTSHLRTTSSAFGKS